MSPGRDEVGLRIPSILNHAVVIPTVLSCSKKYLSQKNVVEKMNANVMQGKVRLVLHLQSDSQAQVQLSWLGCNLIRSDCPVFTPCSS